MNNICILLLIAILIVWLIYRSNKNNMSNNDTMKLDCVLSACNMNPSYLEFIPIFIQTWNKLFPEVDVKVVLINDYLPEDLKAFENNIILFKPIPNVSTVFTSQYIRILYPALLDYDSGILITDIDIFPMNRKYYTDPIKNISKYKFISYRSPDVVDRNQIAICYNIAINTTWSDIFKINSVEDIVERLINVRNDWFADQRDLYKYVMEWNKRPDDFIALEDKNTGFHRLGYDIIKNEKIDKIVKDIKNGKYSDYHAHSFRPYSKYKEIIDRIFSALSVPLRVAILIIYDSKEKRWRNEAEIWKKYMNKNSNIDCFFIECIGETIIKPNYIGTSCEKSQHIYIDAFQKTILALEQLNGYDFYIRTNLSTFIIFDRLISLLNKLPKDIPVYTGVMYKPKAGHLAISGTTIILNDKAKQALTTLGKQKDFFYKIVDMYDDVYIGYLLKEVGIEPIDIGPVRYNWNYDLKYDNNIAKIENVPFIRLKTENIDKYTKVAEALMGKFYS